MGPDVDPATGLVHRPPPNPYPNGSSLLVDVLTEGDGLALIDDDRTWTWSQYTAAVHRAAAALHGLGVGPGDRVAWSMSNRAELPIGFMATQVLGAVWLGVNQPLAAPEKQYLLDDAEASVLVAPGATLAEVGTAPGRIDVTLDAWRALVDDTDPGARPTVDLDPHAPAALAYTSGTTGRPKGAVHSQHNLMWPGLVSVESHPPRTDDRQGTPLAHTILNMLVLGVVSAHVRGTTGVVLHHTDAERFSADVARHRLTRTTLVPTILHDLVHRDGIDPASLATLTSVIVGGAGTPVPLRRAFHEKFGVRAIAGYGLSEAPSGIVREPENEPIDDTGGGRPMAPFALSIRDADGQPVPVGDEGEICVAPTETGPWAGCWTPTLGYWRRPDATAELLRDGVLHTGDIGVLDDDGRLVVRGRGSELILRGGANVYPSEVERVLADHPHVAEAAVYGVPDERLGQKVAAAIVAAVDHPDLDAVRAHCADRIAAYKVPAVIHVLPALPRNAMGKITRTALPSSVL